MDTAHISIIVPVYNVKPYLEKCIQSLVKQVISIYEIILVDDGSTDGCSKICDKYSRLYNNIKVIHKLNGGLSDARNAGLEVAKGEWIGFVDSDDMVDPYMYQTLYNLVMRDKTKLGVVDYDCIDENDCPIDDADKYSILEEGKRSFSDAVIGLHSVAAGHYVVAWNKLYHCSLWKTRRFPVGKINEDQFIMHELYFEAQSISFSKEKLYHDRKTNNSIMGKPFSSRRLDDIEGLQRRFFFFMDNKLDNFLQDTEKLIFNKFKIYLSKLKPSADVAVKKRVKELYRTQSKINKLIKKNNNSLNIKEKLERRLAFLAPILYWHLVRWHKHNEFIK